MNLLFKLAHGARIVAECDELLFLTLTCAFDTSRAILSHLSLRHEDCYVNGYPRTRWRINNGIGDIRHG